MKLSKPDILKAIADKWITIESDDGGYEVGETVIELRLGCQFLMFKGDVQCIDPKVPAASLMEKFEIGPHHGDHFLLPPHGFALGVTYEKIGIDGHLEGWLDGKSGIARLGLTAHVTASGLKPGHCLNLTLEISNLLPIPQMLYYKQPIAQIGFHLLSSPLPIEQGYDTKKAGGGYSGSGPQASMLCKKFLPKS